MGWSWVRPADSGLLAARPLLDLGTGDAATLTALVAEEGLVVGVDRSAMALRAARAAAVRLLAAGAERLPFRGSSFAVVMAGDLFHHLDDDGLGAVLAEVHRVLCPDGHLVAWWYEHPGRGGPDSPAYPRSAEAVMAAASLAGFGEAEPLTLEFSLDPTPPTVGLLATRSTRL